MTHLNIPGAVIIPAPTSTKTDKKGRCTNGVPVGDLHMGLRLLALGFWSTK